MPAMCSFDGRVGNAPLKRDGAGLAEIEGEKACPYRAIKGFARASRLKPALFVQYAAWRRIDTYVIAIWAGTIDRPRNFPRIGKSCLMNSIPLAINGHRVIEGIDYIWISFIRGDIRINDKEAVTRR